jgi:hypothetical protein
MKCSHRNRHPPAVPEPSPAATGDAEISGQANHWAYTVVTDEAAFERELHRHLQQLCPTHRERLNFITAWSWRRPSPRRRSAVRHQTDAAPVGDDGAHWEYGSLSD